MNCKVFPLISLMHPSLCLFPSQHLMSKCLAHPWHSDTLISGIFYQANVSMLMDGCHAHIWLKKPSSVWNKSPDLATHTNNLDTAKWLPPLGRWKDEGDFSWMPNVRLCHAVDEILCMMKVNWWASQVAPLGCLENPWWNSSLLHQGSFCMTVNPFLPYTGTLLGFVRSKW